MLLSELFFQNQQDTYKSDKWHLGYIDTFYNDFLESKWDKKINLLEIGVWEGGSIKLWVDYFNNTSNIHAGDICPFEEITGAISVVGDLYSPEVINIFKEDYFDIIIDDVPHTPESFELLVRGYYSKVKKDGFIIIEDIINKDWLEPLINIVKEVGYSECEVIDVTGKQKVQMLLDMWKNGLFLLKIKR